MENNTYNKVSYKDLHTHVVNYSKTTDKESAEFIINSFSNFIWIYVHLICHNVFKIKNDKHREFVSLFAPRYVYINRNRWARRPTVSFALFNAKQHILYMFRKYTEEEIRTECIIVLLEMAQKYKVYDKPTFHTLIDRVYAKRLYTHLNKMIKDPFFRKDFIPIEKMDANLRDEKISQCEWHGENIWVKDNEESEKNIDNYFSIKQSSSIILEPEKTQDSLSLDWLNGTICDPLFKNLSMTERKILKLYYYNKLTDREVAKELNFSLGYINIKRNLIIKKLQDQYKEKD